MHTPKILQHCPTLLKRFSHTLLPGCCVLCKRPSARPPKRPIDLCQSCEQLLPLNTPACQRCALPMPNDNSTLCGQCQSSPPEFSQCIAPLRYEFPVDRMIHGFKFNHRFCQGAVLAELLLGQLLKNDTQPSLLVATPLHWRRQFVRGFNQAQWLARYLGRRLGIPQSNKLIARVKHTPTQQGLSRKQRRSNLRHAFSIRSKTDRHTLHGQRVALVDDVVTTGSTSTEIAKLLLKAGAETVEIWCLARTPLEK